METLIQNQTQFKTNICLKYHKKNDHQFQIDHPLSGKMYVVGKQVINLLKWFSQPRSIGDIQQEYIETGKLKKEDLQKTIQYLIGKNLVVDINQIGEEFHVSSLNNRIFNVDEFSHEREIKPKIVVVGIPFGHGNNASNGSGKFPFYVRDYLKSQLVDFRHNVDSIDFRFINSFINYQNLKELLNENQIKDWGNLFVYPQESNNSTYRRIYQLTKSLIKSKHIPFFLGGDHSISYPIIRGVAEQHKDLHIVHFDAHTDTYDSALNRYFEDQDAGHHHGNFVSHCLKLPHVQMFHQFGIRGIVNARYEKLSKRVVHWSDSLKHIVEDGIYSQIPDGVPVYVTFDIDFLDPTIAPGTATPVPGGFSITDTYKLLEILLKNKNIVGVDLVEVNPDYDKENRTTQVAIDIILTILNFITFDEKNT